MGTSPATTLLIASGTALWLGLLTSISPCPLATNVAALGYLARFTSSRRAQVFAGLLYTLGRALAYTLVGGLIAWGLLSAPALSGFLERHMNQLLGPFLVLVGMVLLGLLPGLPSFGQLSPALQKRIAGRGLAGSGLLGFLFALAFCPVSAALFFGSLLPLALQQDSAWLLPALYGIGSAAPVLVFGLALVFGREFAGRLFRGTQSLDRWLMPASGWLLVGLGAYLCLTRTIGLF
ncbi:MAG: sulfite exporter TauE/SafE family protein [Planctomycetes bacterium]|nr:sulfite exporter TauE/SafE family protein [Planctomycetota bacterium]